MNRHRGSAGRHGLARKQRQRAALGREFDRFRCKARTRWSDEDNQNVLNNAVYMTLLEEGRHAYFERLGLLELNHFPFVLAQTNIRFVAPNASKFPPLLPERGWAYPAKRALWRLYDVVIGLLL